MNLALFQPAPPAPLVSTDPSEVRQKFRSWQNRVLLASLIGYAIYYFVRKNLSVAMPGMEEQLGLKKAQLGLFLTLHGLLYGVSKFANGFLGDRCNARTFMVTGLLFSAVLNVLFGFSSAVVAFGVLWMLNGWFQGMGFPPCARLLTHWFSPKQLATKMSIWNMSHSIGGALILILSGYLVSVSWRLCFLVPAAIAFVCVIYLWVALPDTPASVGLPDVGETEIAPTKSATFGEFAVTLRERVFGNPYVWLVSVANFFVYILRYAVLDWGPTLLKETKHIQIIHGAWMVAAFEIAGAFGALLGGWMTDRFFRGRGARACVVYMVLSGISLFVFWKNPNPSKLLNTALLCCSGFFIYGPQCLIGIIAANQATKKAAATAVGLTGLFGYASTLVSGLGLGILVQHRGWDPAFQGLLVVAAIGTALFALAWNARPHGYE